MSLLLDIIPVLFSRTVLFVTSVLVPDKLIPDIPLFNTTFPCTEQSLSPLKFMPLLLFPIHYFFTTRLGNDFQWFSDYGNAAWAKHIIHPNIPVITISKLLNYKFFPQIIIFYIYIYIIVIVALLAKLIPSLRSFFASRPPIFQFLSIS